MLRNISVRSVAFVVALYKNYCENFNFVSEYFTLSQTQFLYVATMKTAMRTTARKPIKAPSTASPMELAPAPIRRSSGPAGRTQNSEVGSTNNDLKSGDEKQLQ